MKRILLASILAGFFSSVMNARDTVSDPMNYSEESSRIYAMGDMGDDSGWEGCADTELSTQLAPKIQCTGTRTILVHGGEDFLVSFVCDFEFKAIAKNGPFKIVEQGCQ